MPVEIESRTVSHFKATINTKVEPEQKSCLLETNACLRTINRTIIEKYFDYFDIRKSKFLNRLIEIGHLSPMNLYLAVDGFHFSELLEYARLL